MVYLRSSPLALPFLSICGTSWISVKVHRWFVYLTQSTNIKLTLSQDPFWRHFAARVIGLILVPAIVYLSFFWVHFAILTHSGTGDSFMSPQFQESLAGNELLMNSLGKHNSLLNRHVLMSISELKYYDTITLKHKDTKVFLHSHPERYPLRYDDGRVSSQGKHRLRFSVLCE